MRVRFPFSSHRFRFDVPTLRYLGYLGILWATGCAPGAPAESARHSPARTAGVIDSLLPIEEELRRFRLATPDSLTRLQNGARTSEDLVRTYVTAIEKADTAALARLVIDRAEYAWLIYPESELTRPPYRQKPSLAWFLMQNVSVQGATRVLRRLGGKPLGYRGFSCGDTTTVQGANRIWRQCRMRFLEQGVPVERRLFGGIVERDGTYKFLTFATDY